MKKFVVKLAKITIAVCEKTAGLRCGKFSDLNSACSKVLVPVKIFQFQDMLNENRFLGTFRGYSKRLNIVNCQVQLFLDNIYGVSQSECKIDRPRLGLSRASPRPHMKALGTRLPCRLSFTQRACSQAMLHEFLYRIVDRKVVTQSHNNCSMYVWPLGENPTLSNTGRKIYFAYVQMYVQICCQV